ncbi:MAG: carboxymethylenebutenolidase [Saprospiraceae bacterium]|nr:MAG: carboxymethylenebutenolidase [Saprospiraceae bacterium]
MLKYLNYSLLFLALFLMACNNPNASSNQDAEEGEKEGMAEFSEDKEFQEAHEEPVTTTFNGKGQMISFPTSDGKESEAYVIAPQHSTNKVLFVIHEWWGLNDHIKREAETLFDSLGDVMVMALDLYDGKVATTREKAGEYMQSASPERSRSIIQGAMGQAGSAAKIATIGWCFGGGWSLKASIMAGNQGAGCVLYYGMPVESAADLGPLEADVLGIFAAKDEWITPKVVDDFKTMCKTANKKLTVYSYDADHAFANPSSPRYVEQDAKDANAKALEFLRKKL